MRVRSGDDQPGGLGTDRLQFSNSTSSFPFYWTRSHPSVMSLDGSSLVPHPPVEPFVEPSVVEVVVVDTCVECSSVVGSVAPSGPVVPVSTEVAHFMRVLSGAEPLATLQVVAHVERPDLPHPSIVIQIDMLVWHLFKLRLNRDYCALLYNESFCPVYGPLPWGSPLSTVFCLFVPRSLGELPGLIESVQSECGWGVFVTPVHRGGRVLT